MFKGKKTYLIPIIGFALIILVGALLLWMPICNNEPISFKNAMFTAISGFTTTGLTKVVIANQFNFIGQLILAILMEIGALGFIIFISYFWSIKGKKIKMSDIIVINDSISGESYASIKEHSIFIFKFMLRVQIIGTILLAVRFVPEYGLIQGLWYSVFHAISAFSNSGFDIIGENSFYNYRNDIYMQLVLIFLMIVGSIGILVIEDIKNSKKFSRLKVQTKIVLVWSIILLFIPTILVAILEPEISLTNSFFMITTSRSTGFSVVNLNDFSQLSKIILIILMFIGGTTTSTTGGIKIIPFVIIISTVISSLKGKEETVIFLRKIPELAVRRSFTILILFLVILAINGIIFATYNNLSVMEIIFESVSAISTTGLSITNTHEMNFVQDIGIMSLMFIGRVGILSLLLAFFREDKKNKFIEYPSENVIL